MGANSDPEHPTLQRTSTVWFDAPEQQPENACYQARKKRFERAEKVHSNDGDEIENGEEVHNYDGDEMENGEEVHNYDGDEMENGEEVHNYDGDEMENGEEVHNYGGDEKENDEEVHYSGGDQMENGDEICGEEGDVVDNYSPRKNTNWNGIFNNLQKSIMNNKMSKVLVRGLSTGSMWKVEGSDPFQVFEVEHESCLELQVTIHRGEHITKGSKIQDLIDTPDPYVILKVPGSSNNSHRTRQMDNITNPTWEENFKFYLDPGREHSLHVSLMDANYIFNEELCKDTFLVNTLPNDIPLQHSFAFPGGSVVHTTLFLTKNKDPDLRFSLALCEKERDFLMIRRKKVLNNFKKLLGSRAPKTERQVPIVAVLGSGGGFRAMMCMSGAVKALHESGVMDCATYISGLSGSSWCISHMYANGCFSKLTPKQMGAEIKDAVTSGWKMKAIFNSPFYAKEMFKKYRLGQPISFTDFFGHLLGDVLLRRLKHTTLTDQRTIVGQGNVPMPLYTCLHAKREVSCRAFSEWVEFSPFEIGIAKYGTFMKSEHFGSKFMMGKLVKKHPEPPLHYLQGVWGSAFTILVKRLVLEGYNNKDMVQIMREMRQNVSCERDFNDMVDQSLTDQQMSESDTEDEQDILGKDDMENDNGSDIEIIEIMTEKTKNISLNEEERPIPPHRKKSLLSQQEEQTIHQIDESIATNGELLTSDKDYKEISSASDPGERSSPQSEDSEIKLHYKDGIEGTGKQTKETTSPSYNAQRNAWAERRKRLWKVREEKKMGSGGFMASIKESLMKGDSNPFNSRAGEILNPFKGLSLKNSFPLSPFHNSYMNNESSDEEEKKQRPGCRYQPLNNDAKKLFIVDSGLAFTSPYPLLLRPQRAVDMYLSFDFSHRKTDGTPPFQELILAEKWAYLNKVPFPPVEKMVKDFREDGYIREVYVFKNDEDDLCPVILHFPLVNHTFKTFKEPGVPRVTEEETDFGDFKIFDDPENVYSSTNFMYENIEYERMTQLMEYNTKNCLEIIKNELAKEVERKKKKIAMGMTLETLILAALKMNRLINGTKNSKADAGLRLSIAEDRKMRILKSAKEQNGVDSDEFEDVIDYQNCESTPSPAH